MAGTKGVAWEKAILDYVLGGVRPAAQTSIYFALFTELPTEDSDDAVEVSGNEYARVAIANNSTNFPNSTKDGSHPSIKSNAFAITFPMADGGDWGTVIGFGIYSASTDGILYYWGETPSTDIVDGMTFSIPTNALKITEK